MTTNSKFRKISVFAAGAVLAAGLSTAVFAAAPQSPQAGFAALDGEAKIEHVVARVHDFVCGDQRVEKRKQVFALIKHITDPREDQAQLVDNIYDAADKSDAVITAACAEYDTIGDSFLDGMKKRRLAVSTLSQVMDNMQPPIEGYVESLDEQQKANLTEIFPALADKL